MKCAEIMFTEKDKKAHNMLQLIYKLKQKQHETNRNSGFNKVCS